MSETIYLLRRFRSLHRAIVNLCWSKGCKVTVCQTSRLILLSMSRTWVARLWFDYGWAAEFFSNLKLWQFVTLQPFDLQTPTVPLWKDLEPVVNILSAQETRSILKIGFALSKVPYLHSAYVVTVWVWAWLYINFMIFLMFNQANIVELLYIA